MDLDAFVLMDLDLMILTTSVLSINLGLCFDYLWKLYFGVWRKGFQEKESRVNRCAKEGT